MSTLTPFIKRLFFLLAVGVFLFLPIQAHWNNPLPYLQTNKVLAANTYPTPIVDQFNANEKITEYKDDTAEDTNILEDVVAYAIEGVAHLIFSASAMFLTMAGFLLDKSIAISIDGGVLKNISTIETAWVICRNVTYLFFIFVLLYIAIQTVLGLSTGKTKSMLATVIGVALLMNFSLFFTRVIIDSGNIFAVTLWNKIQVDGKVVGPSAVFAEGLKPQSLIDNINGKDGGKPLKLSTSNYIIVYLGGALVMGIATYVFLAGAVLMLLRTIQFIFLSIFSPLAFAALILPRTSDKFKSWLKKLIDETLLAPIFLFMIYLVTLLIDSGDILGMTGSSGSGFAGAFSGHPDNFAIMLNYFVIIALLLMSLSVAKSLSTESVGTASRWGKLGTGAVVGASIAAGGYAGRQTFGALGRNISKREDLQATAKLSGLKGSLARGSIALADKAKEGSFDVRSTRIGQYVASGAGNVPIGKARGEGGYEKSGSMKSSLVNFIPGSTAKGYIGTARAKAAEERALKLFKDNPEDQAEYLRKTLGTQYNKEKDKFEYVYDSAPSAKALRTRIARESKVAQDKKLVTSGLKSISGSGVVNDPTTAHEQALAFHEARNAVRRLSGDDISKLDIYDTSKPENKEIWSQLSPNQLSAIARNPDISQDSINAIGNHIATTRGQDPTIRKFFTESAKRPDSRWFEVQLPPPAQTPPTQLNLRPSSRRTRRVP